MHQLERDFDLPATDILDVIYKHNRCLIAVRGAIAEEHLRSLQKLGGISSFQELDIDGKPDFIIPDGARTFSIECKNVRKDKGKGEPIGIDFKRTRNPTGRRNPERGPEARFYSPEEFDILAACLWNRTRKWEFAFVATRDLLRHPLFTQRLTDQIVVPWGPAGLAEPWSKELVPILERL